MAAECRNWFGCQTGTPAFRHALRIAQRYESLSYAEPGCPLRVRPRAARGLRGRHRRLAVRPAPGVPRRHGLGRAEAVRLGVAVEPGAEDLLGTRPDQDRPGGARGARSCARAAGRPRRRRRLGSTSQGRMAVISPGRAPVSCCTWTIAATGAVTNGRAAWTCSSGTGPTGFGLPGLGAPLAQAGDRLQRLVGPPRGPVRARPPSGTSA